MVDKALRNAESTRKQLIEKRLFLHKQIAEIDAEIGEIDAFIRAWHAFAAGPGRVGVVENGDIQNKTGSADGGDSPAPKTTGNSSKEDVAAAAREIIVARGQPVMRDELYDLLTDKGLIIQGKDPKMVLSTMLWRMKGEIARVSGGGYWPADMPNPEIGFDPDQNTFMSNAMNTPANEIPDPDEDEE